ncbi:MAG: ABC transporter ATP-binding protein [Parolsenella sp.]|uniref:ABC transporter ATP-binding protein n=1 Tax=Parolsenella sp. TaxID=2083006 RepID=UPI002E76E2B8|nr:ABC transporter ATP-binding protein [Parolsenella sp.]MEE1372533.1 ABC transporter ATP-binding protein [Parolsenella sp.]
MLDLLKRFSGPYMRYFVLGPLCKLIEVFFDLLTPLVIAMMIDRGVIAGDVHAVIVSGVALVAMAVVGLAFTLVCQKMAALCSQGIGTEVRGALYAHVNELSSAELDRFGTPSLITRITNDVNQVQVAVALGVRQLIRWPLLAVGSMVAALLIDVRLGLVFLVSTPLIGVIFWVVMARCVPYFSNMQKALDRIALVCREGLSGVRVVRAFVREDHERKRFREATEAQASIATAVGSLSSILNPATFLIMNVAVCVILVLGGQSVNVGGLTQGQVMAFVNYMTQTLLSIVYVANLVVVFTRASASAARINEVFATEPSVRDAAGQAWEKPACSTDVPALAFDHVTFSYGSGAPALSDVTLALYPGMTLGVIGGTGSGKSTLVSLISRLYDPSAGAISVMGEDVRSWPLSSLRHEVALVPQRASLVAGTIRSNLLWRDSGASDDELWEALEVAQAADFVKAMPQGLDSVVEAGGKNFSGGQRQRLTIARALVGSPSILVMDDSASALDMRTDAALRHAVRELGKRDAAAGQPPLTTVIVSQRVSAVRSADIICVLDHGALAGLGTHEQLLETCGLYREICDSQLKGEAN